MRWISACPRAVRANRHPYLGSVHDQSGAVVPSATVTITDADRGATRTLATNDTGEYVAPNLIAGNYVVRASSLGFKNIARRNIEV
jgi:hypothetical protein